MDIGRATMVAGACAGLLAGAARAQAPAAGLLDPPPPPAAAPPGAVPALPNVGAVADSVIDADRKAAADRQREAVLKYQQALAAAQAGRPAEALRLGRIAKGLAPEQAEIAAFVAKLQREVGASKLANATSSRARAYLGSANTRGQDLLRAGRHTEGLELLQGVLDAVKLFNDPAPVENYRKAAEQELDAHRQAVASGLLPANAAADRLPPGLAPPENARRMLRQAEGRVPAWYAQQKSRLALPMSVDYRRAAPSEVFDDIAKKTGVTFAIDPPVAAARAHLAPIVDLRMADFPAETVLDLVCQKAGIEYVMLERSIVLTTPSKAQEFVRKLPQSLQRHWATARALFPELNPELFGSPPAPDLELPQTEITVAAQRLRYQDAALPPHLASRKALVEAVRAVLK